MIRVCQRGKACGIEYYTLVHIGINFHWTKMNPQWLWFVISTSLFMHCKCVSNENDKLVKHNVQRASCKNWSNKAGLSRTMRLLGPRPNGVPSYPLLLPIHCQQLLVVNREKVIDKAQWEPDRLSPTWSDTGRRVAAKATLSESHPAISRWRAQMKKKNAIL